MSAAGVLDPNTLTVDRLRKELTDRNVPLPKYPKKDILVELYKQHVVFSRAPKTAAGHGFEFSDEDDAVGEISKSRKVGRCHFRCLNIILRCATCCDIFCYQLHCLCGVNNTA